MIEKILSDKESGMDVSLLSMKFHNTLVNWILEVARTTNLRKVVLSGGVFQNAYLTIRARRLLEASGFSVFTHWQVPANDGGLALGQAVLGGMIR
jgi:hydrogenase maturation protein HypF